MNAEVSLLVLKFSQLDLTSYISAEQILNQVFIIQREMTQLGKVSKILMRESLGIWIHIRNVGPMHEFH